MINRRHLRITGSYLYGIYLLLKNLRYRLIAKGRLYREYPRRLYPAIIRLALFLIAGALLANSFLLVPLLLIALGAVADDLTT